MLGIARLVFAWLAALLKSRRRLETEILVLRHQLNILGRKMPGRVRLSRLDRLDRPISPRSPWQNGYVERLIGSIRRECLDHLIVFNANHLRRILIRYAAYYNRTRPHLSLDKDSPFGRPIERVGRVVALPYLGGLHHQYARI